MKRLLGWGLVLLIVATVINDIGRYSKGMYDVDVFTKDLATQTAAIAYSTKDRDKAGGYAVAAAASEGYRLYGYDQTYGAVTLWVEGDVKGTWVYGPVLAYSKGERDIGRLWQTPIVVRVKERALQ